MTILWWFCTEEATAPKLLATGTPAGFSKGNTISIAAVSVETAGLALVGMGETDLLRQGQPVGGEGVYGETVGMEGKGDIGGSDGVGAVDGELVGNWSSAKIICLEIKTFPSGAKHLYPF